MADGAQPAQQALVDGVNPHRETIDPKAHSERAQGMSGHHCPGAMLQLQPNLQGVTLHPESEELPREAIGWELAQELADFLRQNGCCLCIFGPAHCRT
jgi:hypothetical protein